MGISSSSAGRLYGYLLNIPKVDLPEIMKEIGSSGMLIRMDSIPLGPHQDFCEFYISGGMVICLCIHYDGEVIIDGKKHQLYPGTLAILPEKHIIKLTKPVGQESIYFIAITTDYILNMPSPIDTSIFAYSRYIPVMRVSDSKYEDFYSYFRFIYKETKEKSLHQEEIIKSILYALILEISGEYEAQYNLNTGAQIKSNDLIDSFFHLMAVYHKKERSVGFYADKLNITPKYLSTVVKKSTGRPILEWLHEAVLIEAKMLLKTTQLTVQEISERLNFSSPSAAHLQNPVSKHRYL